MTGLSEALFNAFLVSLGVDVIASIIYLVMVSSRERHAGAHDADGDVRFESIWGMILALPALLVVLSLVCAPGAEWWFGLLLLAVLAIYAVLALALSGRKLSRAIRGYPGFIAIGTVPLLFLLGLTTYYALIWLMLFPFVGTRLVVGYVADCRFGLRFARAVRRRDAGAPLRGGAQAVMAGESGFVWPY